MEFDRKDQSQFTALNDAQKPLSWFLQHAKSQPTNDPDFKELVRINLIFFFH